MQENKKEIIVFGGGCFWCTEAVFKSLKGVISVTPGYAGGRMVNPTYEDVSTGNTGHVEVVRIEFNPSQIEFEDLLAVFFNTHDPTTLNRQGNDVGTEYRSVILYSDEIQKGIAERVIRELNEVKAYDKPVVTEVIPLESFYEAAGYHRDYYERNKEQMYCQLIIAPKLEKLQKRFERLLK